MSDSVMVFPAHYGPVVDVHGGVFVAKPLGALRDTLPALASVSRSLSPGRWRT